MADEFPHARVRALQVQKHFLLSGLEATISHHIEHPCLLQFDCELYNYFFKVLEHRTLQDFLKCNHQEFLKALFLSKV